MKKQIKFLFVIFCFLFAASTAQAQTTVFTYQGKLSENGAPANGSYKMQFALYDAATPDAGLLGTITLDSVQVTNGVFTVRLDSAAFAQAFAGAERFLEVRVFTSATDQYVTLAPRQQITSAPYAIRALSAASVDAAAGNNVVNSINNAATTEKIDSNRLSADVVRLKPPASQASTTTETANAPLLDITGTITGTNNSPVFSARLLMNHAGGFMVGGEYFNGFTNNIPAEGAGTRMMWHPNKAAFRAGMVDAMQWNEGNIGDGSVAIGINVKASGNYSAAFGINTDAAQTAAFAAGDSSTASGTASVALGSYAHTSAKQGSFVFSDRSSTDTFRAYRDHTANWRVSNGFRIFTSSDLSTGVTIQSGTTASNWGHTDAVISTSTGAYLSTSGVWTDNSSRDLKTNFAAVDSRDVLRKVLSLPIQTWNYKTDAPAIRHIGAMAQDFYRAFEVGADDRHLTAVDTAGVTMAAIQGLNAEINDRLKERDRRIETLEKQIKQQQIAIESMKKTLCRQNPEAELCR